MITGSVRRMPAADICPPGSLQIVLDASGQGASALSAVDLARDEPLRAKSQQESQKGNGPAVHIRRAVQFSSLSQTRAAFSAGYCRTPPAPEQCATLNLQ